MGRRPAELSHLDTVLHGGRVSVVSFGVITSLLARDNGNGNDRHLLNSMKSKKFERSVPDSMW
jgi:hypothetical protein